MVELENRDIQGIIVSGYGHLPFSRYLFLQIYAPAKAQECLKQIVPHTTNSNWSNEKPQLAINIAFTYKGFEKLGLTEESLKTFSTEFVEGMTEPNRSRILGDIGANAPIYWDIKPATAEELHVLLILQAPDEEKLNRMCEEQQRLIELSGGLQQVAIEAGYMPCDQKEHFGFHDSISQPGIEGSPKIKEGQAGIKAGEFILGYQNQDHNLPPTPTITADRDEHNNLPPLPKTAKDSKKPQLKDFGRNGSYLVFRKLHQDVVKFRRYFRDNFSDSEEGALMAAKIVGRWPSGVPLVLAPDQEAPDFDATHNNNFAYMPTDPHGYKCPIGAHIRRTNPRDSLGPDPQESLKLVNQHRILRRGTLYGKPLPEGTFEDDGKPRGLLFICVNADIRRQFEFIQQTWINNPKFNGLYNEKDPLIGNNLDNALQQMTIQQQPVRQKISLPNFVSVKGGGYFFLPSISALYFLAGVKNPHIQH